MGYPFCLVVQENLHLESIKYPKQETPLMFVAFYSNSDADLTISFFQIVCEKP